MRLSLILFVTIGAAAGGLATMKRAAVYDEMLYRVSQMLHGMRIEPTTNVLTIKSAFSETPTPNARAVANHTHGLSAANRSSGSFLIDLIGRSVARPVWFYQRSGADMRCGRPGSRTFFWVKDLATAPARFEPPPDAICAMVDTDQYVDMPTFLVENYRPFLIYTFQPSRVSADTGDYNYTFDKCNVADYHVAGGGHYRGQVWNYDGDSLKVAKRFLGVAYDVAVYFIERRFMDKDHQLLLLAPSARFRGIGAFLADFFLEGRELKRLDLFRSGFLRLLAMTPAGMHVSTGRPGSFLSCSVPAGVDEAIASVSRTTKSGLTLPMVKTRMGENWKGAELLYEFHKTTNIDTVMEKVSVTAEHVRTYQYFDENDLDDEASPSMVPFMAPLIDGAFCPAKTINNDLRAVSKRLWEQENTTTLTPHIAKVVDEFVAFVLGEEIGSLHPVDEDYLKEKQNRPSQRRILEEAEYLEANPLAKTFIKKEAYQKVTDPRLISTIDGVTKRHYSLYTYALAEVMKKQEWYAFSKTPQKVAERIALICAMAVKGVANSDFERLDGRISHIFRYLEKVFAVSAFRPEYHDDIVAQMETQYNIKAVTNNGLKYFSLLARLSGSPETSVFNTLCSAFTAYSTFRSMKKANGVYYTPREAFDALGMYGGDDGLTADINSSKYVKTAWTYGQKLTLDTVVRGDFGVSFLSRRYGPDVWHGDTNSCCSVYRTLSKFHVTTHLPGNITALAKLQDKAMALLLTDGDTPIVGPFIRRAIGTENPKFYNLCGAWNVADLDVQYPNVLCDWMQEYVNADLPLFNQEAFLAYVETASPADLLSLPSFCAQPEAQCKPGRVAVDGDVIDSRPTIPTDTTPTTVEPQRQLPVVPRSKTRGAKKPQVTA